MSNVYTELGHKVAFLLEKCRDPHPDNGRLCKHGLPMSLIAAEAPEPFKPPFKFRVHCSACVVDAVNKTLKGD